MSIRWSSVDLFIFWIIIPVLQFLTYFYGFNLLIIISGWTHSDLYKLYIISLNGYWRIHKWKYPRLWLSHVVRVPKSPEWHLMDSTIISCNWEHFLVAMETTLLSRGKGERGGGAGALPVGCERLVQQHRAVLPSPEPPPLLGQGSSTSRYGLSLLSNPYSIASAL